MTTAYTSAQERIRDYFNTTGFDKWQRFSRGEARNRIQRSIIEGREQTMAAMLEWAGDLKGKSVLDAGCGPGAFAFRLAAAGGRVTGVDISEREVESANERAFREGFHNASFKVADFYGVNDTFDFTVCLDSLIYYSEDDLLALLKHLAANTREAILFTFTPSTVLLEVMHMVGQLFPKGNTSPAIAQIKARRLFDRIAAETPMRVGRTRHVNCRFYQSTVVELRKSVASGQQSVASS